MAAKARLTEIFSVVNTIDSIYRHTDDQAGQSGFTPFFGNPTRDDKQENNLQAHVLYVGHSDLLNIKSNALIITLLISTKDPRDLARLADIINASDSSDRDRDGSGNTGSHDIVHWEHSLGSDRQLENSYQELLRVGSAKIQPHHTLHGEEQRLAVTLRKIDSENEIGLLKVNEVETRWIKCSLSLFEGITNKEKYWRSFDPVSITDIQIKIDSEKPWYIALSHPLVPESLSLNEIPLNMSIIPVFPFGLRPATLDSFYIS